MSYCSVCQLKINCTVAVFGFAFNAADCLTDCCVCIYIVEECRSDEWLLLKREG